MQQFSIKLLQDNNVHDNIFTSHTILEEFAITELAEVIM